MLLNILSGDSFLNSVCDENLLTAEDSQGAVDLVESFHVASHLVLSSSCVKGHTHVLDSCHQLGASGLQLFNSASLLGTINHSCTRRSLVQLNLTLSSSLVHLILLLLSHQVSWELAFIASFEFSLRLGSLRSLLLGLEPFVLNVLQSLLIILNEIVLVISLFLLRSDLLGVEVSRMVYELRSLDFRCYFFPASHLEWLFRLLNFFNHSAYLGRFLVDLDDALHALLVNLGVVDSFWVGPVLAY